MFGPQKNTDIDAMLMRKIFTLKDRINSGNLNPLWVDRMLQLTAENNREADLLFRSTLVTLTRPSLSDIEELLEREYSERKCGIDINLLGQLKGMTWNNGPDEIDLTIATMNNLFLNERPETEKLIIEAAERQGLKKLPDWAVPALALHAERELHESCDKHWQLNLCLTSDYGKNGFAITYRRKWWLRIRSADVNCPWSGSIHWIFVKPRLVLQD